MSTIGRRLLAAYGTGDTVELGRLYHPEAVLYDPAWWPAEGRAAILDTIARAHAELPGLTVSLHDEFASADRSRVALRWVRHWQGDEPNTSNELRLLTVEDGQIVREVVGYVTLEIPRRLVVDPVRPVPMDTPDPDPVILAARVGSAGVPPTTTPQRWADAFGRRHLDAFTDLYDEDFTFYTAVGWGLRGKERLPGLADGFHLAFPGIKVSLTEEFASAGGTRVAMRFVLDWHNTGEFFGNPPTGERGTHIEQHMLTLRDGRIVEQVVSDVTLGIPRLQFDHWKIDVAAGTPDPAPPIATAGPAVPPERE